jgi:hypothetical protein
MLLAYINYPNPHVTIHANLTCSSVKKHDKENQRVVHLKVSSLSRELGNFEKKEYQFGATPEINDMWLKVDFDDFEFERAVVEYVRKILSRHYTPFARVKIKQHC